MRRDAWEEWAISKVEREQIESWEPVWARRLQGGICGIIAAGFLGLMFYRFFGPGYLNPGNWAIIAAAKRDGPVIEQRQVQRNRPDTRLDRYDQAMVTMRRLQYDRTTWVRREGPDRAVVTIDASSRSYGPRHHEVVVVRDRRGNWRGVDAR